MHHDNYTDSKTGDLVSIEGGQFAFVPNAVPPALPPSWPLSNYISRADRALCELAGAARNLPNPHLIIRPFITREAVLSSQIEGTQCSISDLVFFEPSGDDDDGTDVHEVYKYILAMERGIMRLSELPMCLRVIREVHQILMADVRGRNRSPGVFRKIQNYVAPSGVPIERARYIPPPPVEMERLMNQLETYIDTVPGEFPPLVKLAITHYQFEAVHPFEDGNGRVGRLLITLMLIAEGLLPSPLLYLSAYFERNRRTYYDLLLAVSQAGAWEDWVRFFLAGVEEQSLDAVARTKRILDLWTEYRKRVQGARASSLGPHLVDELFKRPVLTVKRAATLLDVTYRTAQQTIDRLVDAGVLSGPGAAKRNRLYVAREVIDAIEADRPAVSTEPVSGRKKNGATHDSSQSGAV